MMSTSMFKMTIMRINRKNHKLRHNNLHGNAIYVNAAGDWKLFGFDIMDSVGRFGANIAFLPRIAFII